MPISLENLLSKYLNPDQEEDLTVANSAMLPQLPQAEAAPLPTPPSLEPSVPEEPPELQPASPSLPSRITNAIQNNPISTPSMEEMAGNEQPAPPAADISSLLSNYTSPKIASMGYGAGADDTALNNALERQKYMTSLAGLGKAFSNIGSGIAGLGAKRGITPDTSGYDTFEKLGNLEVEGVKAKRAAKDQSIKRQDEVMDLNNKAQVNDPKSPVSVFAREWFEKQAGMKLSDKVSASQIKEMGTSVNNLLSQQIRLANLDLRKEDIGLKREGEQRRKEHEEFAKKKYSDLSDKQAEQISLADDLLAELDQVAGMKKMLDTGPIADKVAWLKTTIGAGDPDITTTKQRLGRIMSDYMKKISGSAISDREAQRLANNIPSFKLNDNEFVAALASWRKDLEESRSRFLESLKRRGKNVEPFTKPNYGVNDELAPKKEEVRYVDGNKYKKVNGGWQKVAE